MTWRGDGGSEGLRTIVPPIVDRLVSFGMAQEFGQKPEVQKSNLTWRELREIVHGVPWHNICNSIH